MTMQFLKFRVILPTFRSCLYLNGPERCLRLSRLSAHRLPIRSYMNRTSDKREAQLRIRDNVPKDYNLIYRGTMDFSIHATNSPSMVLLILGVTAFLRIVFDNGNITLFPIHFSGTDVIAIKSYEQFGIMAVVSFAMLLTIQYICKRYVLRMYYNPTTRTYKAVRVGHLPMAVTTHDFQARSLNRITQRSALPWKNVSYEANGTTLLLFDHGFKTSADYDRMFPDGTTDPEDSEDDEHRKYDP